MPRRKSVWQQFADNFDSTYSTFNTMFSDIEEGQIMRDEVTELQSGIGPGPRSQQLWSYGGKTYDKEITPDMLTGLRNTRLIDNMAKWGDTEGAMKLRQAQATIDASTASTAAQVQQNELMAKTFQDQVAAFGLQNDLTSANIGLTNANKERILATYPVEKRKMIAEALKLEWDNKYTDATFDFQVDEQEAKTSSAQSDAEIRKIEEDEMRLTSTSRVASDISDFQTNVSSNVVTLKENQIALSAADEKIAVNDMMTRFRNKAAKAPHLGGFADDAEAKTWMISQMRKINLTLADDLEENYNAHQLAGITQQSTMFKTSALAAYEQGGVKGLSEAIDKLNGVDDTRVHTDEESGVVTIWAVDPKTKKDLRQIVSGTLGENGTFDMNLQKALDPASSMSISKAYHDDLLVQADIEYKKALAEEAKQKGIAAKNAKAEFKKDDFLVRILMDDPDNAMAWQGLLGEDMTAEDIKTTLREAHIKEDDEQKALEAKNLNDGLGGEDNAIVVEEVEEKEVKIKSGSLEDQIATANTTIRNLPPTNPTVIEAKALLAKLTSVEGLTASIAELEKEISEHPRKADGDFDYGKLSAAGAGSKENAMNAKIDLLAEMKASLAAKQKGIGSGG